MSGPTAPPTSAADLAERALIGALLWDCGRIRDVRDWLHPDDLNHWQARVIYETLLGLDDQGRRVPVTELHTVISAGTYHDSRPGAITAVDLHNYLRATPATPAPSAQFPAHLVRSNHVLYARRVLEASARQIVAVAGSRIQQATEHSRQHPDLGVGGLAAALEQAQARLADLATRLHHADGSADSLIPAALSDPTQHAPAVDVDTIWPGPAAVPVTTRAVLEAEREVLSACLTDPALRAALLGWLTPQDFSRPEHAATWAALAALARAGTPIDYVILAWECQRHHPDFDSPGLSADQLVTMARQTPAVAGPAVRTVAHVSLLRHTDAARDQVQALTADHTTSALMVVTAAEKAYRDAADHARRLTGPHASTPIRRVSAALNPTTTPPGPLAQPTPPHHDPPHHQGHHHHR